MPQRITSLDSKPCQGFLIAVFSFCEVSVQFQQVLLRMFAGIYDAIRSMLVYSQPPHPSNIAYFRHTYMIKNIF